MTGLNGQRVYLDWNASAPLRPEAREAMLAAMDVTGNPSSVHAEGRAARAIVEKARGQVAALAGCEPDEVVFTSGATEAAALFMSQESRRHAGFADHDAVHQWADRVDDGLISFAADGPRFEPDDVQRPKPGEVAGQFIADGETGILFDDFRSAGDDRNEKSGDRGVVFADMSQFIGRYVNPWPTVSESLDLDGAIFSSTKIGGPTGAGGVIVRQGVDLKPLLRGGGQEKGRRSGTENVIGIAGFGAAAEAARRDLDAGVWVRVENLRNSLEERVASAAPDAIFFGREAPRLPNTSCFAVPGWAGEMQVMQMDLAGFAVSAGSACSSGKVKKASRVLMAMGFDEETASSAIRVSMGPTTTEAEVMAFADAWIEAYRRRKARAA